ncbi:hypothetical protein CEXT_150401 [Caerostris extrusa]|uniref:Uncharacterized protein n=1 Tax=Caerostris extrusa TaxID=172846 RepID=A0AAV4XD16_CAEEX|nr:hypothetical protein CEXT_150401 [Caerostris extrusa]
MLIIQFAFGRSKNGGIRDIQHSVPCTRDALRDLVVLGIQWSFFTSLLGRMFLLNRVGGSSLVMITVVNRLGFLLKICHRCWDFICLLSQFYRRDRTFLW